MLMHYITYNMALLTVSERDWGSLRTEEEYSTDN